MERIKDILGKIALWALGLFFILVGVASVVGAAPLSGLCLLLLGAIFLPVTRDWINSRLGSIEAKYYQMIGTGLFVASMLVIQFESSAEREAREVAEAEKMKELAAKGRQVNIDKFAKEKESILMHLETLYVQERYQDILDESQRYTLTEDASLIKIRSDAKAKLKKIADQKRTAELLAKVRGLKDTDLIALKDAYVELSRLNPLNAEYVEKRTHFSAKVQEIQDKQEKWVKLYGEPPKQYSYHGPYYQVTSYLERIANDPDSIDVESCTQVYMGDDGWVVGCTYRGKNGFGGLIRKSSWFTLINGRVVDMTDDLDKFS